MRWVASGDRGEGRREEEEDEKDKGGGPNDVWFGGFLASTGQVVLDCSCSCI